MFSCHASTETKQRRLYFQPLLLSDNCRTFRNRLGRAIVGGGFQRSASWAGCKWRGEWGCGHGLEQKASDISAESEGFLSHFWRKVHCPKKGLVCTGRLAWNSCAGVFSLSFMVCSGLVIFKSSHAGASQFHTKRKPGCDHLRRDEVLFLLV